MAQFIVQTKQGETYAKSLSFSKNTGTTEVPIWTSYDLSDCSALLQIRERPGSALITSVSTEDGGIVIALDNLVTFTIPAEKTDLLVMKRAYYDLFILFPDGRTKRLLEGQVRNSLSVTDVEVLL